MAKNRIINTRFWHDDYISLLQTDEKLLFLYFLTNPATDICGVYELPKKIIVVESGIKEPRVNEILQKFEKDGKVIHSEGWIGVHNFIKYQVLNPKVKRGIELGLKSAPRSLLDRLSIDYNTLSDSNLNLNSNSNLNVSYRTNPEEESKEEKEIRTKRGQLAVKFKV